MPSRISQLAQRLVQDGRIDAADAQTLSREILTDNRVSREDKRVLKALLTQHGDKFEPAARDQLQALMSGQPPAPTPRDLADPSVLTKHEGMVEWRKPEGGQLFVDGVSFDDVIQGSIANCYMVGAFSSVAWSNPELISNAIKENPDGTFTVRFFEQAAYGEPMKPVEVTVDGDLPMADGQGPARYAKGRDGQELWVGILEKAYAEWKGGYEAIGNGGRAGEVMSALTGQKDRWIHLGTRSPDSVFEALRQGVEQRTPMAAGTHGKDSGVDYGGTGVYAWHVYSIHGVSEENGERLVELRNPWGRTEPGNDGKDDGIFKMKLEDFMRLYNGVYLG
jgi:hypothetical protein